MRSLKVSVVKRVISIFKTMQSYFKRKRKILKYFSEETRYISSCYEELQGAILRVDRSSSLPPLISGYTTGLL